MNRRKLDERNKSKRGFFIILPNYTQAYVHVVLINWWTEHVDEASGLNIVSGRAVDECR